MKPACSVFLVAPRVLVDPRSGRVRSCGCCPMSLFRNTGAWLLQLLRKGKLQRRSCRCPLDHHIVTPHGDGDWEWGRTHRHAGRLLRRTIPAVQGESPYLEKKYSGRFSYPAARSSILLSPWLARLLPSLVSPADLPASWPSLPSSNMFAHSVFQRNFLKKSVLPSHIV